MKKTLAILNQMEEKVYPDPSAIFAAKEERRRQLSALSWEEKVAIIDKMRKAMPRTTMQQLRAQMKGEPVQRDDTPNLPIRSAKETTMHQRHYLSHSDAAKIIDTLRAELEKQGKGAAIAVVDNQGELLAFLRTDGCKLPSITIAINKAFTAAREQKPSKAIGESSRDHQWPMSNFGDPRYTAWGGGVPIVYQGQTVGGVGVSGLPEAEDMVLAALGAATIA